MKGIATLLALVFSLATTSAWACPGDKATDDKQSTPKPPTPSLTVN